MSVLAGKRIVITRASDKAQAFADQLRALGADPLIMPTIEIAPVEDTSKLTDIFTRHFRPLFGTEYEDHYDARPAWWESYYFDWIIFTSANAFNHVWQYLGRHYGNSFTDQSDSYHPTGFTNPFRAKIAVVGNATAKAVSQYNMKVDLIGNPHTAEGLFQTMSAQFDLNGLKILLPQGDLARPVLANLLRQAGAEVTEVIAYRNIQPPVNIDSINQPIDAITFTSASTVENFCSLFDDPLSVIGSAFVVCIGPVTADAARDLGLPVHEIADPHTMEGLLNALITVFERNTIQ